MKSILLVDDTPANLGLLLESLRVAGYRLLVAESGERALHQLHHTAADLVLLDVMMPGIDGFETCRRLKCDAALADIPVIFMTARDDVVDKLAGFAAGGVDYVTKPLHPDEVLARVRAHLQLRELQAELARKNAELADANTQLAERNERLAAAVHLRQAAQRALAEALDRPVVLVSRNRDLVFATKSAERLLERFFPDVPRGALPAALCNGGTNGPPLRAQPLPGADSGELRLLALEALRPEPTSRDLEPLGLTPREAEVLFWMAEGKTNPEIAVILDSAMNTVKRQAQSVLEKLGVETRTAAALKARAVLDRR